jgi:tight adherence protein C
LVFAGTLVAAELQRHRAGTRIAHAIDDRLQAVDPDLPTNAVRTIDHTEAAHEPDLEHGLPLHWLDHRLGRLLVADEDRQLIEQCGLPSARTQLLLLITRALLCFLLPVLAWVLWPAITALDMGFLILAVLFCVGFMLPKWLLARRAARRRARAAHELPLFVDLLRLLQGVGLSLDQSLQIIATEFVPVLKVLAPEIAIANRHYQQGRSREHSLRRFGHLYGNENLASLVAMMVQSDRHGGAVQEPLRLFGERLRERRQSDMKERIGRITVKMTGVMVVTLLPSLVIITAGPGFLAVIRSLGAMAK